MHVRGPLIRDGRNCYPWNSTPLLVKLDDPLFGCQVLNVGRVPCSRGGTESRIDTARLATAAYNSYDKHCGTNAIAAAESDLLGRALDALRKVEPFVERLVAANKDDRELAEMVINIDDILSKAGV